MNYFFREREKERETIQKKQTEETLNMLVNYYKIVFVSWAILILNGFAHTRHLSKSIENSVFNYKQNDLNFILEKLKGKFRHELAK